MPSSKEVRARQNRQKERIAALHAERRRQQQRRRRYGGVAGIIVLVIIVAAGFAAYGTGGKTKVTVAPTTVPAKNCVGLKDTLPSGSPPLNLSAGPEPTVLTKKDTKFGTGAVVPKDAKKVTVNYVGIACTTGKIFDSSYKTKPPSPIVVDLSSAGAVILGWKQGIPGMKVGGERLIAIPPELAYGAQGRAPAIGPNEPLFFLVAVEKLG